MTQDVVTGAAEDEPGSPEPAAASLERPEIAADPGPGNPDGGSGLVTSLAVLGLILVLGGVCTVLGWPRPVTHVRLGPQAASPARCTSQAATGPVTINNASGPGTILNVVVGRSGEPVTSHSAPLAIQSGLLCPGEILSVAASDFASSGNGPALTPAQFASWAKVDRYGTHVTVYVEVAPRNTEPRHWGIGQLGDFGGYSGTVSLNDPRALGAHMAVHVHILYPDLGLIFSFGFLAAFGGFVWAWLVHRKVAGQQAARQAEQAYWLRNLILRFAVLLAATVPVVNLQVLGKPDWAGTLSQYITLGTLVGAAAVAATPTLWALVLPTTRDR